MAHTDRLQLRHFPQAGKLQIAMLYRDKGTIEIRPGKTVTPYAQDLALHPEAGALLSRFQEEVGE